MLVLNDLRDKPRSTKARKRVGRGYSGARPGHGGKGQTARTGVALGNFQGGQTPIERRLPKIGAFFRQEKMMTVSLEMIDKLIEHKRIAVNAKITQDLLEDIGVIKPKRKFKLVGKCNNKIEIEANAASKGAIESIKKTAGSFSLI